VLPLEVREPGLDCCEPRVLVLELLGFSLDLLRSLLGAVDFALELLRSQPGGVDLLLDVGIPSPVEHLQPQAPLRQRCTRRPIAAGAGGRRRLGG